MASTRQCVRGGADTERPRHGHPVKGPAQGLPFGDGAVGTGPGRRAQMPSIIP